MAGVTQNLGHGPQPLRALIEHTARTVAADNRFPERQVTALQVLATLELADAVRSTVVELEPITASPAYERGDKDPTPNTAPWCSASDPSGRYGCTWGPGHPSPHVAGDGARIREVWA